MQALEAELSSHEVVIQGVATTAQELVTSRHFASQQIQGQRDSLLQAWNGLKEMVAQRTQLLNDSLEVQQVIEGGGRGRGGRGRGGRGRGGRGRGGRGRGGRGRGGRGRGGRLSECVCLPVSCGLAVTAVGVPNTVLYEKANRASCV